MKMHDQTYRLNVYTLIFDRSTTSLNLFKQCIETTEDNNCLLVLIIYVIKFLGIDLFAVPR